MPFLNPIEIESELLAEKEYVDASVANVSTVLTSALTISASAAITTAINTLSDSTAAALTAAMINVDTFYLQKQSDADYQSRYSLLNIATTQTQTIQCPTSDGNIKLRDSSGSQFGTLNSSLLDMGSGAIGAASYSKGGVSLDQIYVVKAGDNMSGGLNMNANRITQVGTPTTTADATNKTYVDTATAACLKLAGGTVSGDILFNTNNTIHVGNATTMAANVYSNQFNAQYGSFGTLATGDFHMGNAASFNLTGYAFRQSNAGLTYLNCVTGQSIRFRVANVDTFRYDSSSLALYPETTNTLSLGTSSKVWTNVYLQNNPTVTSDQTLKTDIADLTAADIHSFLLDLTPIQYHWIDTDDGQLRYGYLAQAVEQTRIAHNMPDNALVDIGDDGTYHLRYGELTPLLNCSVKYLDTQLHSSLIPSSDDTCDIGSSSFRYKDLYIGGSIYQTSDRKFKENIKDLETNKIVTFVNSLRPKTYTMKNKKTQRYGLIAQEVIEAQHSSDLSGIVNESSDNLSVNYLDLIAPLIAYCQDLERRLSKFEKVFEDLKPQLVENRRVGERVKTLKTPRT